MRTCIFERGHFESSLIVNCVPGIWDCKLKSDCQKIKVEFVLGDETNFERIKINGEQWC